MPSRSALGDISNRGGGANGAGGHGKTTSYGKARTGSLRQHRASPFGLPPLAPGIQHEKKSQTGRQTRGHSEVRAQSTHLPSVHMQALSADIEEMDVDLHLECEEELDLSSQTETGPTQPTSGDTTMATPGTSSHAHPAVHIPTLVHFEDPSEEYEQDIEQLLHTKQRSFQVSADYMSLQTDISHEMRSVLIDWFVEVVEEYHLKPDTFYLSCVLVDRFLERTLVDRTKLQLVGMTCMLVASKYIEIWPPSVQDFVYISDNTYTAPEVLHTERVILGALEYSLSSPCCWEFFTFYCKRLPDLHPKTRKLAEFLMERFAQERVYLRHLPSVIATSALSLALLTQGYEHWSSELQDATGGDIKSVSACMEDLYAVHATAATANLKAVVEKYSEKPHDFFYQKHCAPMRKADFEARSLP